MVRNKAIRVLIAKPGLDGHDKGAKIIARALQVSGMEVIYTGIRQTIPSIVNTAIQEGVDIIGLSILSGSHLPICRELMERLLNDCSGDKIVVIGGIIPKRDVPILKEMGVDEVFRSGSSIREIISFIMKRGGIM